MVEDIRRNTLQKMIRENGVTYKDILKVCDAFQIASGQDFAIGSTYGLLDFIVMKGNLYIYDYCDQGLFKDITTANEFADVFFEIDRFIDIKKDADIKKHCSSCFL